MQARDKIPAGTTERHELTDALRMEEEHHVATYRTFVPYYVASRDTLFLLYSEAKTLQERIRELAKQQGKAPA
jgi:hypothetical protein